MKKNSIQRAVSFWLLAISCFFVVYCWSGWSEPRPPSDLPVALSCDVLKGGQVHLILTVKDQGIHSVIVKVRLPKGVSLENSEPKFQGIAHSTVKWLINTHHIGPYHIKIWFSRTVKKGEIEAKALFKMPKLGKVLEIGAQ